MNSRLFALLIIVFSSSTHSMDLNTLTQKQKKLIEKYSATTFKEDLTYFAAVNVAIYKNDSGVVNIIKDSQLRHKIKAMKHDGIDRKVMKCVKTEYLKNKERTARRIEFCNYVFWSAGIGLVALGSTEIIKRLLI